MTDDPIPLVLKPPRRMLQPTKDELRRLLAVERAKVLQLEKDLIFLAMERPVRAFWLRLWRGARRVVP